MTEVERLKAKIAELEADLDAMRGVALEAGRLRAALERIAKHPEYSHLRNIAREALK